MTHRLRRWLAPVAAISLVVPVAGVAGAQATPPAPFAVADTSVSAADKIDKAVLDSLSDKGAADFWVRFADRPNLSQYRSLDWDARGKAVYDALNSTADSSQKSTRAILDKEGVSYETYFISNAIRVSGGDQALITSLAAQPEVAQILAPTTYDLPEDEDTKEPADIAPAAVEWGIADINADDVWATYGVTGEDIVVANIDSGVQYNHPALVNQYRGNNGDGTFDHDYNWFDAAGSSPDFPQDFNSHGTHVMGTMVGDDGAGNQIGVAPGATWIAANGCCPSDQALIDSGEWILAPTDLDGNNADASKRPHIVNNSWGTTVPSNDPFMEDVIVAWEAAGIFGVFANGNSGPNCNTSGAPGSRILSYSVGNYQSSHVIAASSGRGTGQGGETKPNISAPGSSVRSAVPGNGYGLKTGTSMASPHVAGAVALLWSAAPALVGDVDGTIALLEGGAVDTANAQCGGTADDNNVFGEGRLDVLASMEAAPVGDTGTLAGAVTNATTDAPIADATVAVDGEVDRTASTDADGEYSFRLPTGSYQVTASKFGFGTQTASVTVATDAETVKDFELAPVVNARVRGSVFDGSGQGYPLYAKVSVEGTDLYTFTNPETGAYQLNVPRGGPYTLVVQAQYPGYQVVSRAFTVTGNMTVNVDVPVDASTCTAYGYSFSPITGAVQTFDGTTAPAGWTVTDEQGTGQTWRFDDPEPRGNLTGGSGGFAIVDSDFYGSAGRQNTSLVSPVYDLSAAGSPVLQFKQDLNYLSGEFADVDVSTDGGTTWTNVLRQQADLRGNTQTVAVPAAAGENDVRVRFHYYVGSYDWWWEVDDVRMGDRPCLPSDDGGYVVGNVYDEATDAGLDGARVANDEDPSESAVTAPTPADTALDDGFYWLYSEPADTYPFTATARNYESQTQDVTVVSGDTVRADYTLGTGIITATPTSITTAVTLGQSTSRNLTISNSGTATATVDILEVPGDFVLLQADGTKTRMSQAHEGTGAPLVSNDVTVSFANKASSSMGSAVDPPARGPAADPWTYLADYPSVIMDNRVVSVDGTVYSIGGTNGTTATAAVWRWDADALTWVAAAPLPAARNAVVAGAVDGKIVVTGGWAGNPVATTFVYDPAANSWASVAANPVARSAAGQAVLDGLVYSIGGCTTSSCTPMSNSVTAYDAAADSWQTLASYPVSVAFASCAGVGGQVVCTGGNNGTVATNDTYAYDPAANAWSQVADAPVDTWASAYAGANGELVVNGGVQAGAIGNASMSYDPDTDAWTSLPASNSALYRGGAACGFAKVGGSVASFDATSDVELLPGFDECGSSAGDVSWLSVDPPSVEVDPGESVVVKVITSGNVAQPGTYTAALRLQVEGGTTQVGDIPVTMVVAPPRTWGKVLGTVNGTSCGGTTAALPGAVVDAYPVDGSNDGFTVVTAADGSYAMWVIGGRNYTMTTAKDDYRPVSVRLRIPARTETVKNFTLRELGC